MRTTMIGILQGLGVDVDLNNIVDLMADWVKALPATIRPHFKLGSWSYTRVGTDGRARGVYVTSAGKAMTGVDESGRLETKDVSEVDVFGQETLLAYKRYYVDSLPAGSTREQINAAYLKVQQAMDPVRKILIPFRNYDTTVNAQGLPLPRAVWDEAGKAADAAKAVAAKAEADAAKKEAADAAVAAYKSGLEADAARAAAAKAEADAAKKEADEAALRVKVNNGDTGSGGMAVLAAVGAAAWMFLG